METAKSREEAFRRDLAELLKKHEAELEVTDDRKPWGTHTGICVITMDSKLDAEGELIADYTEFRL
jgi:hypothetical protein